MARELEAEPNIVNITYVPLQEGDPIKTVWNNLLFHANKPVPVPVNACFEAPAVIKEDKKVNGETQRTRREFEHYKFKMVDMAKENPFFRVEGFDRKQIHEEVLSKFNLPKTSAAYRSWVLTWLQQMTSTEELDDRWETEEHIRIDCTYDAEDERFLMPIIEARRMFLRGTVL